MNEICINGLRLNCHVGVPDEERAVIQELLMDVVLRPSASWENLADDLDGTIDYAAVVGDLEELAAKSPRRLIETFGLTHKFTNGSLDLVQRLLQIDPR